MKLYIWKLIHIGGGNPNFRCMLMGFEMAKAQRERHFGSLVDILMNLMTEFAVKQTS